MTKEEERGINMFRDYLINDCSKDHLVKELDGLVKEYKAKQLILSGVSQRRELLPDFLYKDDYGIKIGYHGDTEVSKEWDEYLEKLGNCG